MPSLLVGCAGKLTIGQVRVGCRDVCAVVVSGASGLAETRGSSMQAGLHLFVVRVVPQDPLKVKSQSYFATDSLSVSHSLELTLGLPTRCLPSEG
jgi:hypothetical protein